MAESHSGCEEINEKIIAVEDLSLILWNLVRGQEGCSTIKQGMFTQYGSGRCKFPGAQ